MQPPDAVSTPRIGYRSLAASGAVLGLLFVGLIVALVVDSDRFELKPPDAEQTARFAARLQVSLNRGELGLLISRSSGEAIVAHALAGRGLEAKELERIAKAFERGLPEYFEAIGAQAGARARWEVVRHEAGPPAKIFVRVSGERLGLLELRLALDHYRRVVVVDLISHLGGTSFGETLRRHQPGLAARTAREIGELLDAGKAAEALARLKALPESLTRERAFLILRVRAAAAVAASLAEEPDEELDEALAFVQGASAWPDDDPARVILLTHHWRRGEHEQALKILAGVEARAGQDPALDAMRARLLAEAKRTPQALELATRAAAALPASVYAQSTLLGLALRQRDWQLALEPLSRLRALGISDDELAKFPGFLAFTQSEVYPQR